MLNQPKKLSTRQTNGAGHTGKLRWLKLTKGPMAKQLHHVSGLSNNQEIFACGLIHLQSFYVFVIWKSCRWTTFTYSDICCNCFIDGILLLCRGLLSKEIFVKSHTYSSTYGLEGTRGGPLYNQSYITLPSKLITAFWQFFLNVVCFGACLSSKFAYHSSTHTHTHTHTRTNTYITHTEVQGE